MPFFGRQRGAGGGGDVDFLALYNNNLPVAPPGWSAINDIAPLWVILANDADPDAYPDGAPATIMWKAPSGQLVGPWLNTHVLDTDRAHNASAIWYDDGASGIDVGTMLDQVRAAGGIGEPLPPVMRLPLNVVQPSNLFDDTLYLGPEGHLEGKMLYFDLGGTVTVLPTGNGDFFGQIGFMRSGPTTRVYFGDNAGEQIIWSCPPGFSPALLPGGMAIVHCEGPTDGDGNWVWQLSGDLEPIFEPPTPPGIRLPIHEFTANGVAISAPQLETEIVLCTYAGIVNCSPNAAGDDFGAIGYVRAGPNTTVRFLPGVADSIVWSHATGTKNELLPGGMAVIHCEGPTDEDGYWAWQLSGDLAPI